MSTHQPPTHPTQPDHGTAGPGDLHFRVRQRLTLMVNRYEIRALDGPGAPATGGGQLARGEGALLAFAEQKRMAFKEQVTFFADEAKTRPVFGFKARSVMDLGATYDVVDEAGRPIGSFKKEFAKSLVRSTWRLGTPDGLEAVGQERNPTIAVVRRIWELVPIVGEIPVPFLFHFDFRAADGQVVLTSEKRPALRDVYEITVPAVGGWRLDWRVAAAMAVALDALQSR